MSIDPNTPVLLGAGQATEHLDDQFVGLTPQQLGARACQAALADTGAQEALATLVDRLACVRLFVDSCAGGDGFSDCTVWAQHEPASVDYSATGFAQCLSHLLSILW
jgi:acetyl-CoA C-acetyltransferase